jgi:4'-phosphopantetheinyl transferase EntD
LSGLHNEERLVLDLSLQREERCDRAVLSMTRSLRKDVLQRLAEQYLHAQELSYFYTLSVKKRKREFLMGRVAAKRALNAFDPSLLNHNVAVQPGVFQQPLVSPDAGLRCRLPLPGISITHSGVFSAAVAFPLGHPVGIDLEQVEASHITAMKSQIAQEELPLISGSEAERYTRVRTVKEALSKVLQCGLTVPFSLLRLDECCVSGNCFQGRFLNFRQYRFESFSAGGMALAFVAPVRTQILFHEPSMRRFFDMPQCYNSIG